MGKIKNDVERYEYMDYPDINGVSHKIIKAIYYKQSGSFKKAIKNGDYNLANTLFKHPYIVPFHEISERIDMIHIHTKIMRDIKHSKSSFKSRIIKFIKIKFNLK